MFFNFIVLIRKTLHKESKKTVYVFYKHLSVNNITLLFNKIVNLILDILWFYHGLYWIGIQRQYVHYNYIQLFYSRIRYWYLL